MTIGTKVRTLYEHSETGTIVKPRNGCEPPSADWFIIKFDSDARRLCVHRSMLTLRNMEG